MKKFMSVIVCVVVVGFMTGCPKNVVVPAGCEKSFIYKIPNADLLGMVGVVAISEGLKANPSAKPYVCNFANSVINAMKDDQLTYLDMSTIIVDNVKWINSYFGANVLIYQALFMVFDKPVPMNKCDIDYLNKNMKQILAVCGC